ncbi:MAG: hypothetical protein HJJLKODD_01191 [Phycisphaerae bacterium]|nr:hypothetical protein [Phycisphaerae bacterium]
MKLKIVIVHSDPQIAEYLSLMCAARYQVSKATDVKAGLQLVLKEMPALALVGFDAKKQEGLQLMRHMKHYGSKIPVLIIGGRGAGELQQVCAKYGAKGFVEWPVDQKRLDREISKVLQTVSEELASVPPITDFEDQSNKTELENTLNRQMKCVQGKNQVHLYSELQGIRKTKPRIVLKCPLRAEYGMPSMIYFEYIRDVCCGDHTACPAVQQFQSRQTATHHRR